MPVELNRFEPLYPDGFRWFEPTNESTGLPDATVEASIAGTERVYSSKFLLDAIGKRIDANQRPKVALAVNAVSFIHLLTAFHYEASQDPAEAEIAFAERHGHDIRSPLTLTISSGVHKRPVSFDPGYESALFFRTMVPVLESALGAPDEALLHPDKAWDEYEQAVGGWMLHRTSKPTADLWVAKKAAGITIPTVN